MQNIRLSFKAAYALHEKIHELLEALDEGDVKDVCIRAGDDIHKPLDEVEVHVSVIATLQGSAS